jgi:hypothetical protein
MKNKALCTFLFVSSALHVLVLLVPPRDLYSVLTPPTLGALMPLIFFPIFLSIKNYENFNIRYFSMAIMFYFIAVGCVSIFFVSGVHYCDDKFDKICFLSQDKMIDRFGFKFMYSWCLAVFSATMLALGIFIILISYPILLILYLKSLFSSSSYSYRDTVSINAPYTPPDYEDTL